MGVEFGNNDENEESNPGPAEEIISVLDKPSNSTSFISAIMPSEQQTTIPSLFRQRAFQMATGTTDESFKDDEVVDKQLTNTMHSENIVSSATSYIAK